ncbi:MAG TPA: glycosyltransferase family 4 protein [Niastella sp.]
MRVTAKQDKKDQPVKILYFLSHPIQYFSPLLKELAGTVDLEVVYFSDSSMKGGFDKGFGKSVTWDVPLLDGYKYTFLKNYRAHKGLNNKFGDVWNPGAWKKVRKAGNAIIMVNDWTYSSSWLVLLAAKLFGKKVWLRAENPLNQELKKSRKVLMVKKIVFKHFLFRWLVDKCLYIGTQSKSFFKYYGVDEKRLVFTPYSVDNNYFNSIWMQSKAQLSQVRERLKLPKEKKIVLFSGKYIDKKRPLDLLQAFAALNSDQYFLVMVGDGALRPNMERFIADKDMQNVLLTGFINQSEMPYYYAIADVFVMCSGPGETWGLAVNEAMNFSKPVIVSDTCGSSADLVQPGINGYVFEEGNINKLTAYLKQLLENDELRNKMGAASGSIIQNYSIQKIVNNIKQAVIAK